MCHCVTRWIKRFLRGIPFLLEIISDKLHFLDLYLADISWNSKKWACHFEENNWQQFPANNKNQTFKRNSGWQETCSHCLEFDSFSVLNNFSNKISDDINKYYLVVPYNEMCQPLEDLTLWTHIFQMTNMMLQRVASPSTLQDRPMNFNVTVWKVHW